MRASHDRWPWTSAEHRAAVPPTLAHGSGCGSLRQCTREGGRKGGREGGREGRTIGGQEEVRERVGGREGWSEGWVREDGEEERG